MCVCVCVCIYIYIYYNLNLWRMTSLANFMAWARGMNSLSMLGIHFADDGRNLQTKITQLKTDKFHTTLCA